MLLWGAVRVGLALAFLALMAPFFISYFQQAFQQAQSGGAPDPAQMMPRMLLMQGMSQLFNLLSLLVVAVIYCAAFRAVLHPDQSRYGYLRIGVTELYLVALIFGGSFALVLGLLVVIVPFAIVIVILAATHVVAGAVLVAIIGVVALFAGLIYVGMRFALVGPMIVDDGKFHLFDSWTLTKGRVLSLFVIALSLFGIVMVAELVVVAVAAAVAAAVLGVAAGGFGALPAFFRLPPPTIFARMAPLLVIYGLAAIPLAGCSLAVVAAPWARAYRDLVPPSDAAEAFT